MDRVRSLSVGVRVHGVPDNLVTAGLARELAQHVGADWYAVVLFSDGGGAAMPAYDSVPSLSDDVLRWMAETAAHLNRHLHSGGHWIVAWSNAGEPVLLWRDGDVVMRVAVELAVKADGLAGYGVERVVEFAASALAEMRTQLDAEAPVRPAEKAHARR